jgi:nicotinamidase-related amidase
MNDILIVVDCQNDFITGSLKNNMAEKIIPIVKKKVELAQKNDNYIFFTKHSHDKNYLTGTIEGQFLRVEHCIKNTWGWEITDELKPFAKYVYEKSTPACIELAENLKDFNIDCIELIGTHWVFANALLFKSFFPNSTIVVDSYACTNLEGIMTDYQIKILKDNHIIVI